MTEYTQLEIELDEELIALKADIRRTVRAESDFLRVALIALEKGRYEVVKDHIERVLDQLNKLVPKE